MCIRIYVFLMHIPLCTLCHIRLISIKIHLQTVLRELNTKMLSKRSAFFVVFPILSVFLRNINYILGATILIADLISM